MKRDTTEVALAGAFVAAILTAEVDWLIVVLKKLGIMMSIGDRDW